MRLLKDWLKAYLEYTAYNEAPEHFHFWTGVGVISAALRRKTWIDMRYFQWTPNFFIVLVAPPGIVNKSTTINTGRALLEEIEGIKFGPESLSWQALIAALGDASEAVMFDDKLFHQMSCLTCFASELGTFLNFKDAEMTDTLVDLWDGRAGVRTRRTMMHGSVELVNPWLTIIGGTTPAWLSENLPKTMVGGGFSSRCIWLFATRKKCRIAYPQKQSVPADFDKLRGALIQDLRQISMLQGEFTLTEGAFQFGTDWYDKHSDKMERGDPERDGLGGYLARTQTHVHKLAMVLSAAKGDSLVITKEDLRAATEIMSAIEGDIPRVFQSLNTSAEQGKTLDIVAAVRSKGKVRRTELYQMFFHTMSAKEFAESIESAVQAGHLLQTQTGNTIWLAATGPVAVAV